MDHEAEVHRRQRRRLLSRLRSNFFTGLIVLAPIALTAWLIWKVIGWIDGFVLPWVPDVLRPDWYVGLNVKGIGLVIFFVFLTGLGWLMKGLIGRTFLGWGESLVDRMPVVRSVYTGLKQITETVFTPNDKRFDKVCLVEFPSKGLWALGFISADAAPPIQAALAKEGEMIMVFIPLTPNPSSCFLLAARKRDVIELDMSIEDAAKLIISGGLLAPPEKQALPEDQTTTRLAPSPGGMRIDQPQAGTTT
jgi:uncharacterized membrane protein